MIEVSSIFSFAQFLNLLVLVSEIKLKIFAHLRNSYLRGKPNNKTNNTVVFVRRSTSYSLSVPQMTFFPTASVLSIVDRFLLSRLTDEAVRRVIFLPGALHCSSVGDLRPQVSYHQSLIVLVNSSALA